MTDSMLRVEGLRKSFDGTVANDGIDLSVEAGEFHGIIGPNGSGKTTLFDVVTGRLEPDEGRVFFDGEDVTSLTPDALARRGLVRTFQITAPFEALTVRENMLATYTGESGIRVPDEKRARAQRLLEMLDLDPVADEPARDLSGGQQKLLELGRVLMLDPDCLLLDEPTASVNPVLQERLLGVLRRINDEGTTLVLIEHDMSVVRELVDRLSVLNRGRIISQGSFDAVTDDIVVREAYLGRVAGQPVATDARSASPASGPAGEETAETQQGIEQPERSETPGRAGSAATGGDSGPQLIGRDLVTGYGTHRVVNGVSVRSRDGVTCIFGPNGSGKSTLLSALAGVLPVWSGQIEYDGRPMTGRGTHKFIDAGITMVPQEDMIFEGLTVRENLQLGGAVVSDTPDVDTRIAEVLSEFQPLNDELSTRAGALSGGQQAMLGFARAMMSDADVYLLDEPTSSLAPGLTEELFGMVDRLVDDGAQVVLVEQNVREALSVADYVYILAGGQLQFEGSPSRLQDDTTLLQRFLGLD